MGFEPRENTYRPVREVRNDMQYIQVPPFVGYKDLQAKQLLSPSSYKTLFIANKTTKRIRDLISEKAQKGQEVGSASYINKSNFYFLRNKALQASCFVPALHDMECMVPILPNSFKDLRLKAGDILISKDANIGETAYLDEDLPYCMISGGLVRLRFPEQIRHYVFAFMKSDFFKDQVYLMAARGATIRHAKSLWLDAVLPFPNKANKDEVIDFVGHMTKAVVRKEAEVKRKYNKIVALIDKELKGNQGPGTFTYNMPSLKELQQTRRINASIYSMDFKHNIFYIENYKHGSETLQDLGFKLKRGPNLAVSVIGRSIYSEERKSNFYKLIEPMDITDFMTVQRFRWLGNKTKIPCLRKGDILFGAEGSIGKVYVFCDDLNNTITNYHGMSINTDDTKTLRENIFIGCFLSYLKEEGVFEKIAVGGQGGSVGKEKLLRLKIPDFPPASKEEIAKYYYNPMSYDEEKLNASFFEEEDTKITEEAGILQLDKQCKAIKTVLEEIIQRVILNKEVKVSFDFLKLKGSEI